MVSSVISLTGFWLLGSTEECFWVWFRHQSPKPALGGIGWHRGSRGRKSHRAQQGKAVRCGGSETGLGMTRWRHSPWGGAPKAVVQQTGATILPLPLEVGAGQDGLSGPWANFEGGQNGLSGP